MRTPAELYKPSPRPYPEKLPHVEYPGHYEIRRVDRAGVLYWKGRRIFISEILHGESIGFEVINDGLWSIYFAQVLLGRYDEREDELQRSVKATGTVARTAHLPGHRASRLLPMCPVCTTH